MAEVHFIYMGGWRDVVPRDATHVSIHPSVTVIPAQLFCNHPNIVELICHDGVERIEYAAFCNCRRLKRVIMRGVKVVGKNAFNVCIALEYVECPKLETIKGCAFYTCKSLRSIELPSVMVVDGGAFRFCLALKDVTFGKKLRTIGFGGCFFACLSLERITIPLEKCTISNDAFQGCVNLKCVDLVEKATLQDTITSLLLEDWRDDMNDEIHSINQILPNAHPGVGGIKFLTGKRRCGEKAQVIRDWMKRALRKIIDYKVQHRRLVNEAAAALQLASPEDIDIVMSNVLPFLELPPYRFEG